MDYDCDHVISTTVQYGQEGLLRRDMTVISVYEFFASLVPDGCALSPLSPKSASGARWVDGPEGHEWNCTVIQAMSMERPTMQIAGRGSEDLTLAAYFGHLAPDCIDEQAVADAIATLVYVPEWVWDSSRRYELNCETVRVISDNYYDRDFLRDGAELLSFRDVYWRIVNDCSSLFGGEDDDQEEMATFVIVERETYLRDCGGSTCAVVGRAPAGGVLQVIGNYNGWYHVAFKGGTAYIASWLTTRDNGWLLDQADFHTIVTTGASLRKCPDENCDIVGEIAAGTIFEMVNSSKRWDEVVIKCGTAFVDSRFTEPGPAIILESGQAHRFASERCLIVPQLLGNRSEMGIAVTIAGEQGIEIRVDLYSPKDRHTLHLAAPARKVFEDDDVNQIRQSYENDSEIGIGLNILEIEIGEIVERVGYNARAAGYHLITLICRS